MLGLKLRNYFYFYFYYLYEFRSKTRRTLKNKVKKYIKMNGGENKKKNIKSRVKKNLK